MRHSTISADEQKVIDLFSSLGTNQRINVLGHCYNKAKELSHKEAEEHLASVFGITTSEPSVKVKRAYKKRNVKNKEAAKTTTFKGRRSSKGELTLFDTIIKAVGDGKEVTREQVLDITKSVPTHSKNRETMVSTYLAILKNKKNEIETKTIKTDDTKVSVYVLTPKGQTHYNTLAA